MDTKTTTVYYSHTIKREPTFTEWLEDLFWQEKDIEVGPFDFMTDPRIDKLFSTSKDKLIEAAK